MTQLTYQIFNSIYYKYEEFGFEVGLEIDIHSIINQSILNLLKYGRGYTLQHQKYYRSNIIELDHCFTKEVYAEVRGLANKFNDVNYSDVINFALDRFFIPYTVKIKTPIVHNKLQDMNNLIKILRHYKMIEDEECEAEDNFIFSTCPLCGEERFYYCADSKKNKIYVGCIDHNCNFANAKGKDVFNVLESAHKKQGKGFVKLVSEIYDILKAKNKTSISHLNKPLHGNENPNLESEKCDAKYSEISKGKLETKDMDLDSYLEMLNSNQVSVDEKIEWVLNIPYRSYEEKYKDLNLLKSFASTLVQKVQIKVVEMTLAKIELEDTPLPF